MNAHLASFAADWIEAWNSHDLDRILDHYAETIVFASPFVTRVTGEPKGIITGKAALSTYFAKGLALRPDLRFELEKVYHGVGSITIQYRAAGGTPASECMVFDDAGRVQEARAHYG